MTDADFITAFAGQSPDSGDLIPTAPPGSHALATAYAIASLSKHTTTAYRAAWANWSAWCRAHGSEPLAASQEALAAYLSERADSGISPSSIAVALAAMRHAHKLAGRPWEPSQRVLMVVQGIRRTHGTAPRRQASAATLEPLAAMLAVTPHVRDRAILLIGFGGALRRSELVGLDLRDVTVEPRGLTLLLRRSKGDQEGEGRHVAIAAGAEGMCPTAAFGKWLKLRGTVPGPLFGAMIGGVPQRMDGGTVSRIVSAAAKRAGLSGNWSSHSLRAGLITAADKAGESLAATARHARHRKLDTTARYIRHESPWEGNVSEVVLRGRE